MPKKKTSDQVQATYPSQVWTPERMDTGCYKPWSNPSWSLEQKAVGLVREMISGLYALHQEHIENSFAYQGWPSDPKIWSPLWKERLEMVGIDELPPNADDIPTRYGVTFKIARDEQGPFYPHPDDWPSFTEQMWLDSLFHSWVSGFLFVGRRTKDQWISALIPKLLTDHQYSEEARDALQAAADLLDTFQIGSGSAKALTGKLMKETQGKKAIQMTEQRISDLRVALKKRLEEPFGIARDFTHLAQDFAESLNHALLVKTDVTISSFHFQWIPERNPIQDTRGSALGDSLARLRPHWNESDSATELIERWCTAYLTRLADFAHRYTSSHELPAQLKGLSEYITGWQIHPSIEKDYELLGLRPVEREAIDRVKRLSDEAITALLQKLPPTPTPAATFTALWGEQGEQQVRLALNELNMLHPPAAKGKGRYVAVMHAAYDYFGKSLRHLKDWPVALAAFFPNSKWSKDITPLDLTEAGDSYRTAYKNMMLLLRDRPR